MVNLEELANGNEVNLFPKIQGNADEVSFA